MNVGLLTLTLLGSLVILLALGLPLVFCLGGIATLGLYLLMGDKAFLVIYFNTIEKVRDFAYITIPMFTYMAYMLERSGAAEALYTTIQYWTGKLAGSLAIGMVIISTILAAMVGLSSAAIITMGVTVLPSMLRRGYNKDLAMGSIAAGSTLGILIPPSVLGILYAGQAGVSVGYMFMAGFLPGLLVAGLFILYIGLRCYLNPSLGPPLPANEAVNQKVKLRSLSSVILPGLLVIAVLGSIFLGIATPLESSAVGALGSIIIVALNRKLTWKTFLEVNQKTLLLTCTVMWVLFSAGPFRSVYIVSGAQHLIQNLLLNVPFGAFGSLIVMQLILLFLGCFLDEFGILIIAMPLFVPVIRALNIDPVWFGILFIINMEIAELTPPVGLNIFYMKAIVPKGTRTEEIYRSVMPFVGLLGLAMIIIIIFPGVATWLPNIVFKR